MSDVLYERIGSTAVITLNRPDAANAYSPSMVSGLVTHINGAAKDSSVRTLVLTGAGKIFSAGGDLKAMEEESGMFAGDPTQLRDRYQDGIQQITRAFDRFQKPAIAAVQGAAVGAGLGLSLMCDLRIAAQRARFGATFAKVGLIPGDGSQFLLMRAIGYSRALQMVLTAKTIDAATAQDWGLVHEVVDNGQALQRAMELAEEIALLPPTSLRLAKQSMVRGWESTLENTLQMTAAFQSLVQRSDEHKTAVRAMIQSLEDKKK